MPKRAPAQGHPLHKAGLPLFFIYFLGKCSRREKQRRRNRKSLYVCVPWRAKISRVQKEASQLGGKAVGKRACISPLLDRSHGRAFSVQGCIFNTFYTLRGNCHTVCDFRNSVSSWLSLNEARPATLYRAYERSLRFALNDAFPTLREKKISVVSEVTRKQRLKPMNGNVCEVSWNDSDVGIVFLVRPFLRYSCLLVAYCFCSRVSL